jgi:hypothetical protein
VSALDVTPDLLTGFLIPECCLEVWDAETTITSASPITSQLVADRTTALRLLASGTPVASDALEILASVGGVPGGGRSTGGGGARFLMRPTEDPSVDWRGQDPPIALSFFGLVDDGLDTVNAVSAVTSSAGTEIVCWEEIDTGPALRPTTIYVARRELGTGAWGAAISVYTESMGGAGTSPRIVRTRTDSSRLDIYALTEAVSPQEVIRFSSLDDGETWERSSVAILQVAADRLTLQVAAGGGQVLLFVNSDDGTVRDQYASSDDGNSFELVATQAGHTLAVAYSAGQFFELAYVEINSATLGSIVCVTRGSAFTDVAPAAGTVIKSEVGSDPTPVATSSGALIVADDGTLFAYWITSDSAALTGNMRVYYSPDGGASWDTNDRNAYASGATTVPFGRFAVAASNGGATIAFGAASALYWGRLGGWTNRTLPSQIAGATPALWSLSRWRSTYLPFASHGLDDMGAAWTESLTATPTITKSSGFLHLTGTTGDAASYEYDSGVESNAAMVKVGVRTASGDGLTRLTLHVTTTESTARTFGFTVSLNYDAGTITVRDDSDASVLYGPVAIPLGDFEFFLAIGRSGFLTFSAYLGVLDLDGDAPQERVYLHRLDAEGLGAFGVAETTTTFVVDTDDSADFDCRILYVLADLQGVTGFGLGRTYGPDELFGAPFSPRPTYVRDGVSVRALGSCNRNDSWAMTPSAYYAVANALPQVLATPRRGHLSTGTSGANYAFRLTTGGDAGRGGLWAIYLDGITYASATISIYTGSAWSSLGSVSFGERIEFTSVAGTVTPAEAPDAARWYREGELVGCRVQDSDLTIGEVLANTEGAWSTEGQSTRLQLADEVTAGSRTGTLWHRRAVVYLYLSDAATFEGLRLAVAAYSGGPTIGTDVIAIGRVRVLGDGVDQTRAVATELGEVLTQLPDGGASVTRARPDRLQVELSHTRGSLLPSDGAETPYVRALEAGPAVGSGGDPATIEGMLRTVGRAPLVYLPAIPVRSGSSTVLGVDLGARGAVYGRFVPESYRIESVTGHAERGEIVRTSVVTIVEEV